MIKAAVIGHPISHSKSPLIHNYWIAQHGLEGSYEAVDIPCETLEEDIAKLVNDGFAGFNVTIPHKEAVYELCDEVGETAHQIGAVNTVRIEGDKLIGTNTDVFGFIHNIKSEEPDFRFDKGLAVVLGAGGASRAVIHGLLQEGAPEVIICNRTASKAEVIKGSCMTPEHVTIAPWDSRHEVLQNAALLVNTTALGMRGQAPLEIDLSLLPQQALVTDIIYTPLETDLLVQAKSRGHKTVTGIGMLLHQARPAFQAWFGILPDVTPELRQKVLGNTNEHG